MESQIDGALLIDGNSLIFKAFYGTYGRLLEGKERSFKADEPINALRTFSFMIINLIKKFNYKYIIVAFDKGSKTFRHEEDYYKKNRKKAPQELFEQLPFAKTFLELMGIKTLEFDELEADEIIGIFSFLTTEHGINSDVITTDKDLLQLVNEKTNVHLYKGGKKGLEEYNHNNFFDLMSVFPFQIPDLKALMGDASDNIKGVPGIGPKMAIKIINESSTIESLINNRENLPNKLLEKIEPEIENIIKYKKLTKIIKDPNFIDNFVFTLDLIKRTPIQKQEVIFFLNEKSVFNVANKIKKEF